MFTLSQKEKPPKKLDSINIDIDVYDSLFDCPECGSVFRKIEDLALHSCSAEKINKCFGCGKHFPTLSLLALHKCSNKVSYQCFKCHETFYDACEFVLHYCLFAVPVACYDCEIVFSKISDLALHKCTTYSSLSLPLDPLIRGKSIQSSVFKKSVVDYSNSSIHKPVSVTFNHLTESTKNSSIIFEKSIIDDERSVDELLSVPLNPLKRSTKISNDICDKSVLDYRKPLVHESSLVPLNPLVKSTKISSAVYHESAPDNSKLLAQESSPMPLNPIIRNIKVRANMCDEFVSKKSKSLLHEPLRASLQPLKGLHSSPNVISEYTFENWHPLVPKTLSMPLNPLKKSTGTCPNDSSKGKSWTLIPKLIKSMFFKCDQCDKLCTHLNALNSHKQTHKINHKCEICHRTFSCTQKLLSHRKLHSVSQLSSLVKSANLSSAKNVCDNQKSLPQNNVCVNKWTSSVQYECDICHVMFSSFGSFRNHKELHKTRQLLPPLNPHKGRMKINHNDDHNPNVLASILSKKVSRGRAYSKQETKVAYNKASNGKYECDICHRTFLCSQNLHDHKQRHKNLQSFGSSNASIKSRKIDVKKPLVHKLLKVNKCYECNKVYTNQGALNLHKRTHKQQSFKTSNASIKSKKTRTIDDRKPLAHQPLKVYKCYECNKIFTRQGALNLHKRTHKRLSLETSNASIKSKKTGTIDDRKPLIHKPLKVYKCYECNKVFTNQGALNLHKRTHKQQLFKTSNASIKSKKTGTIDDRKPLAHQPLKVYKCYECNKVYTNQGALNLHKRTHKRLSLETSNSSIESKKTGTIDDRKPLIYKPLKVYKCYECNKIYTNQGALNLHKRTHKQQLFKTSNASIKSKKTGTIDDRKPLIHKPLKVYKCYECNKIFTRQGALNLHKRTHKRLSLETSNASIKSKKTGTIDDRKPLIHKPLKVYKCYECNKIFTRQGALNFHKRTHKMRHECDICHKTFSCNERLFCHKKLHGSLFKCDLCIESFSSPKALSDHMLTH